MIGKLRRELDRSRMRQASSKRHRYLYEGTENKFGSVELHARTFVVRVLCCVLAVSPHGYPASYPSQ